MKPALMLIALFAVSLLTGAPSRAGSDWLVDDDGADCRNADFTTIQAAVNAAAPGDTLRAKGDPDDVVIDADLIGNGITIKGASGVTIEGFTVRHGHDNDIMLVNANGNTVRRNILTAAVHDGIELFNSDDNLVEHNLSVDNFALNACGINLAGGSDRNVIRHNTVRNNEWGIQIAGSNNNVISQNNAVNNRGNGIRNVANSSGTVIDRNRVFRNGLTPGVLTGATNAGIRLATGTGLIVAWNHAFDNVLFDIRQETATATFENNHCDTSLPPGLCVVDGDDGERDENDGEH
jgi:parallel beta-helix repeat protein